MRTQKKIDADPGKDMRSDQLEQCFSPKGNGQHPYFTRNEWRNHVEHNNTLAGYWDWVSDILACEDVADEPEEEETSSYTIKLTKQIVVTIEATSYQAALDDYNSNTDEYSAFWFRAEAVPVLIGENT